MDHEDICEQKQQYKRYKKNHDLKGKGFKGKYLKPKENS